jgi:hypothetical protein
MQDLRQIEHEIEATRNRLDDDLEALTAKVDPRRAVNRARAGVRERVDDLTKQIPGGDSTVLAAILVVGALLVLLPRRRR